MINNVFTIIVVDQLLARTLQPFLVFFVKTTGIIVVQGPCFDFLMFFWFWLID